MDGNLNLKSSESIEPSFCFLCNYTSRTLDIIWIDYQSKPVHYRTMLPKTKFPLKTFKTHPWIFKDTRTGERMQVNNQDVFWPQPTDWQATEQPQRFNVNIHFPLRTLRENAAWKVLESCANESVIDKLEIPSKLIKELQFKFNLRN